MKIAIANLSIGGRETPLRNWSTGRQREDVGVIEGEGGWTGGPGGVLRGKRITETAAYARVQRVGVRGNTVAMRAWLHIAITSVPRAGGHKAFCRTMACGQEARSVTPGRSVCERHPYYTLSNMYMKGER